MAGILELYDTSITSLLPDETACSEVINEVIDQINQEFTPGILQSPTETDRQRIQDRVVSLVGGALRKRSLRPGFQYEAQMAEDLTRRIVGLGFLDLLLPLEWLTEPLKC